MTKSIGMLIAGEISHGDTRLALCGLDMGRPVVVVEETTPNVDFAGLGPLVHSFLAKYRPPQIRGAAFVVPGPVHEGVSLAANLPWNIDARALSAELGIERIAVLADAEAVAHAIPTLSPEDLLLVSSGAASEPGNQAVIVAGACPGMSGSFWNGTEQCPFVSEGIHADFAPSDEDEAALALHLSALVARVTVELLLSSSGLGLIYQYHRGKSAEPERLRDSMHDEDAATVILREATAGTDPVCRQAVDTFLRIFGSAAANLALTFRATGGVYIAGRVVPGVRAALTSGVFLSAFCRKAPMQGLLERIPIHAIMSDRGALLGAATVAARELRGRRVGGWAS